MGKPAITRLFIGSLVALAGSLVLLLVAGGLAVVNNVFIMSGPDVVGVRSTPAAWVLVVLAILAVLIMMAAAVTQFVAWIAAVLNTAQLENKSWFILLLVTGLLSFGFVGMIIYLVAGPDGQAAALPAPPPGGHAAPMSPNTQTAPSPPGQAPSATPTAPPSSTQPPPPLTSRDAAGPPA